MKRKIVSVLLAVCTVFSCAFALAGCKPNSSELSKSDYIKAFDGVTTTYTQYVSDASGASELSAVITPEDLTTINRQSQMTRMVTACVQFVGFLKNLCNNANFTPSESLQQMQVIDTSTSHTYLFKLKIGMSYNSSTSIITSKVYCEDGDSITYLLFEIKFNFSKNELEYFTLTGAMGGRQNLVENSVNYFRFQNNELKMLEQSSNKFSSYAGEILLQTSDIMSQQWQQNLPDYSTEYVNAMLGIS